MEGDYIEDAMLAARGALEEAHRKPGQDEFFYIRMRSALARLEHALGVWQSDSRKPQFPSPTNNKRAATLSDDGCAVREI